MLESGAFGGVQGTRYCGPSAVAERQWLKFRFCTDSITTIQMDQTGTIPAP